jgi:type IV pilus assembly protein PilC
MLYPAMIIVVVIWVIAVMMVVVVPKLLEIFSWADNLPVSTRILISISDFFVHSWWLMLIVVFWSIIWIWIWRKTPAWKYYYDKFMLKIPIFWNITQKIILSKFARVLSGMLTSWVSIVEWLRITSDAVGNEVYRQRILFLRDDIKRWLKIYESIENDPLFPEMMVSMIQIWEQTAKVDEIILKVADFYDEEVDNTIWVINKLLEPIIIVTMAWVVGFIAIAIMQPIMNLADTVSNG